MEVVYILKELIIDVPDTFDQPYLLQQKVFEFLEHGSTKYIKNFCILYRIDKLSSKHIEKLISDWDVKSIGYAPEGNSGKGQSKYHQGDVQFSSRVTHIFRLQFRGYGY